MNATNLYHIFKEWILSKLFLSFPKTFMNLEVDLSDYEFKMATTEKEFKESYEILRPYFQNFTHLKPMISKLRTLTHLSIPSSKIAIVKKNDEVIACAMIMTNKWMALPIEKILDLKSIHPDDYRIAEISCFVMKPGKRYLLRKLFFPFLSFIYVYLKNYMKIEDVLFTATKGEESFFKKSLNIKKLSLDIVNNDTFSDQLAEAFHVNLLNLGEGLKEVYFGKEKNKNLYEFFMNIHQLENHFQYPQGGLFNYDIKFTYQEIERLFQAPDNIFSDLAPTEKKYLLMVYRYASTDNFEEFFDVGGRESSRFNGDFDCFVDQGQKARLVDVSRRGFRVRGDIVFSEDITRFDVKIGPDKSATVYAEKVWQGKNQAGYRIINSCNEWSSFISMLENTEALAELLAGSPGPDSEL